MPLARTAPAWMASKTQYSEFLICVSGCSGFLIYVRAIQDCRTCFGGSIDGVVGRGQPVRASTVQVEDVAALRLQLHHLPQSPGLSTLCSPLPFSVGVLLPDRTVYNGAQG